VSIGAAGLATLASYGAMEPWPDLLSEQMKSAGQTLFWLEVIRTAFPFGIGAAAGCLTRWTLLRAGSQAAG
jgi:hypothetical protein